MDYSATQAQNNSQKASKPPPVTVGGTADKQETGFLDSGLPHSRFPARATSVEDDNLNALGSPLLYGRNNKLLNSDASYDVLMRGQSGPIDALKTRDQSIADQDGSKSKTARVSPLGTASRSLIEGSEIPTGQVKETQEPADKQNVFFTAYASHLRVQSNVDSLFKLKSQLKLPQLALSQAQIIGQTDKLKADGTKRVKKGSKLRNLSALRTESVTFLDQLERGGESIHLNANASMSRALSQKGNNKVPHYKEILNEIASTRSLMLANTPRQQQLIGMSNVSPSARRLTNRSLVHGSNLKISEHRFSSLRNSPSGKYLVHPNSRIPDHPADILQSMRPEPQPHINPSYSLSNIMQTRNFIADDRQNQFENGQPSHTFNKRSLSLQPAPMQDQQQQAQIQHMLKLDQSSLTTRIQEAYMPEVPCYPKPSFSVPLQEAIDNSVRRNEKEEDQSDQKQSKGLIESADLHINLSKKQFVIQRPINVTKKRSLMKAAHDIQPAEPPVAVFSKKKASTKAFMQLPELVLSPQASTRTVFGTHRKSETVASRNVLDQIKSKTTKFSASKKALLESPIKSITSTPQQQPRETSSKKPKLRALLDGETQAVYLDKTRNATEFHKQSNAVKGKHVQESVGQVFERRIEEIKQRNADSPKLKLFSPYKRKSTLHDDQDTYDFKVQMPYDTNLAFEALDQEGIDDSMKGEYMALLKMFKFKMETSDVHFGQAMSQQAKQLQSIIQILDLQQKYQADPTNELGFLKYSQIKELYLKKMEQERQNRKKKKRADQIAGVDGTTTVGQSRLDVSEAQDQAISTIPPTEFERASMDQSGLEPKTPMPRITSKLSQVNFDAQKTPQLSKDHQAFKDSLPVVQTEVQAETADDKQDQAMRKTFQDRPNSMLEQETGPAFVINNQSAIFEASQDVRKMKNMPSEPLATDTKLLKNFRVEDRLDNQIHEEQTSLQSVQSKRNQAVVSPISLQILDVSPQQPSVMTSVSLNTESDKSDEENSDYIGHSKTLPEGYGDHLTQDKMLQIKERRNDRRNTEMADGIRGLGGISSDKLGSGYVKIGLESSKDLLQKSLSSDSIEDEELEIELGQQLKRQKLKKGGQLKTKMLSNTLTIQSEQIQTNSTIKTDDERTEGPPTITERTSEGGSTSELETDSQITTSSKAISKDTTGVHDIMLTTDQFNKPMVARKGKFQILKANFEGNEEGTIDPMTMYSTQDPMVSQFIDYCDKLHDNQRINPYPILHQIYQGNFIVKNQSYTDAMWLQLFNRAILLAKSQLKRQLVFEILYLENCKISDDVLAELIKLMLQAQKLKRVILVKMEIGLATSQALILLNKNKTSGKSIKSFAIDFRDCTLVNLNKRYPDLANSQHPMLSLNLTPISILTLVKSKLRDGHLDLLKSKLFQAELLDLSFNEFSTDGLIHFIADINKQPQSNMHLRSINFAGNSLKDAEYEKYLQQGLHDLIQKSYLQHLDLSLTSLTPETAKLCIKALQDARSIQSLHLTGPNIEKLRSTAIKIFGASLFNNFNDAPCADEISNDWNEQFVVPHLRKDDISSEFASSILGIDNKNAVAMQQNHEKRTYSEQRLVISRLMGRSDISNAHKWTRNDQVDSWGQPVDIRKSFSPVVQNEIQLGLRKPDDLCWIMGHECWICEMWTYYMPVISKQDIAESYGGLSQTLCQLNETQERVFEKIISEDPRTYNELDIATPYIIGNVTRHKFVRLEKFQDHMMSLDPDGEKIKVNNEGNNDKIFNYYRQEWANVIKKSGRVIRQPAGKIKTNLTNNQKGMQIGPLHPYRPHTDRSFHHVYSEYDVLWATSLLTKPGKQGLFVVYKFDKDRVLRAHFKTYIPIRSHQIVHHHVLPKIRQKETHEEREARRDKNYYFDIFSGYKQRLSQENLIRVLEKDFDHWEVPYQPQLQIVGPQGYNEMTKVMLKYTQDLIIVYKRLQSTSTDFPLLNYKVLADWVKQIGIVNDTYPITQFNKDYEEFKVAEKKKAGPIRRRNTMTRLRSLSSSHNIQQQMRKSFSKTGDQKGDQSLPANLLSRHQFLGLLVKIAVAKFGNQPDQIIQPSGSLDKLVKLNILPSYTKGMTFKNPDETKKWVEQDLLPNRDTQKFLFLNQFSLKQIFDKLCEEQDKQRAKDEDSSAAKKRKSFRRKSSGIASPTKRQTTLSPMLSIAEEPESNRSPLLRRKSTKLEISDSQNNGKSRDFSTDNSKSGTPKSRMSQGSGKMSSVNQGSRLKSRMSSLISQSPVSRRRDTTGNHSSYQLETFSRAVSKDNSNTGLQEESKEQLDTSFFFGEQPSAAKIKQTTPGKVAIELDTQTSINIPLQRGHGNSLLDSGASFMNKNSSLKKSKGAKKDIPVKIQAQFLPDNEKHRNLSYDKAFEVMQKVLKENLKKLVKKEVHQHAFTWAKSLTYTTGNSAKTIEKDKMALMQLDFIEFLTYVCILGHEVNKLQIVSGMEPKETTEAVAQILKDLMHGNGKELVFVPENDTRGLNEFAQDILLQGKVQPYVPETEAIDAEEGSLLQADMLKDSDDDGESSHLLELLKPKNFVDKWQALANEREKKKSPMKPALNPNRPNQELIDNMLKERQRRVQHEEYLKVLAQRKLNEDSDSDEY